MNPGALRGHVYLTFWPVSQSAVMALLTVDLGMICRVTGGFSLMGSSLISGRDAPASTVSLLVLVNRHRHWWEHLCSALIDGNLKLTTDYKYFHCKQVGKITIGAYPFTNSTRSRLVHF